METQALVGWPPPAWYADWMKQARQTLSTSIAYNLVNHALDHARLRGELLQLRHAVDLAFLKLDTVSHPANTLYRAEATQHFHEMLEILDEGLRQLDLLVPRTVNTEL
jgi:hypothetical protein